MESTTASKGQDAMRARQKMSTARQVFWPLQAGRPRKVSPGLLEAVILGRSAGNRLYQAASAAGLSVKDATCVLVCATEDGRLALGNIERESQDLADIELARRIYDSRALPAGVAFALVDRELGEILMHGRAFGDTEWHVRLIETVLAGWSSAFKQQKQEGAAQ